MDNEDVLLARWLGWPQGKNRTGDLPIFEYMPASPGMYAGPPHFRASNEYAGALLGKLERTHEILFNPLFAHVQGVGYVAPCLPQGPWREKTWRDVVVDASLAIISNAGNGNGDRNG